METIKFYCYRDLYKTCYSLKYFRMLFFFVFFSHNCAGKKNSPFSDRLTTDDKKKKIKLSHLGMRKLLNGHSRTKGS